MNNGSEESRRRDAESQRRELRIGFPGGISFSFRGFDVVLMIVCAVLPLTAYFMWEIKTNGQKEHRQIVEALEVQTYVLALPPEEREALNLAMPESVKRRTVEERRRMRELRRLEEAGRYNAPNP